MIADRAGDRRSVADVGRSARLELLFARRGGRTVLADAYAEPPLRVGRLFPEGDGLHMILASSSPGIFGGDRFEQVIRLESGARVRLTSQSALQVHPASSGDAARLVSAYHLAPGATLHCRWEAMIPFSRSRLEQRIDVRLAADARLHWSDAFMAGRVCGGREAGREVTAGERWSFASLTHEFRVTRDECLEYLERYRIVPSSRMPTDRWIGGAAAYFGTTLISGAAVALEDVERLQDEVGHTEGLEATVDRLAPHLVVARLASLTGVPFHDARGRLDR